MKVVYYLIVVIFEILIFNTSYSQTCGSFSVVGPSNPTQGTTVQYAVRCSGCGGATSGCLFSQFGLDAGEVIRVNGVTYTGPTAGGGGCASGPTWAYFNVEFVTAVSGLVFWFETDNGGGCAAGDVEAFPFTINTVPCTAPNRTISGATSVCNGNSVTLTMGSCGAGKTVRWYNGSCGTTGFVATGNTYSPSPSSTTTYYARCYDPCGAYGSCDSHTVSVINSPSAPTAISGGAGSYCPSTSVSLTSSCSSGTVEWYTSSCGGTSVGSGNTYNSTAGSTTTYYARCENTCGVSSCVSRTVTRLTNPSVPTAISGGAGSYCPSTSVSLTSSCSSGTVEWYTLSCGGTSVGSGNTYNSTAGSTTTYYARCENTCGVSSCVSRTVTRLTNPSVPTAISGGTGSYCPSTSVSLSSSCSSGTVEWYTSSCGGTSVGSGNTYNSTAGSTTTYYARCESTCGVSSCVSRTVTRLTNPSVPAAISGGTGSYCPSTSVSLSSSCSSGTVEWYTSSCGGTSVGSGNTYNSTAGSTTTYYARCENTCGVSSCVSRTVSRVSSPSAPTGEMALTTSGCPGYSSDLSANCATGTVRWYNSPTATGLGLSDPLIVGSTQTVYARCFEASNPSGCQYSVASSGILLSVSDAIPPTVICKDTLVYLNASGIVIIDSSYINNGSSDNCSVDTMYVDMSILDCSNIGVNSVKLYVVDGAGNIDSCTSNVTVLDTTSPMISCNSSNFYINSNGEVAIDTTGLISSVSDNCVIDSVWVKSSDTLMSCFNVGVNNITIYVTDNSGNIDSCISMVTIIDTLSPVAICKDTTIYLDANGQITIDSSYIDNGSYSVCYNLRETISISNFTCTNIGANNVWLVVEDVLNRKDSCMAVVTVLDTLAPIISSCPSNITEVVEGNCEYAVPDFTANISVTDNCTQASSIIMNQNPAAGSLIQLPEDGSEVIQSVVISASDNSGNIEICNFDVNISCQINLLIPQFLSPNGDNKNDVWFIEGIDIYPNSNVKIFNRWGSLIYEMNAYNNTWDGKANVEYAGQLEDEILPSGTYFYIVDKGNGDDVNTGYVVLQK